MTKEISWHVELALKSGELDNFLTLTREMVAATESEPGALVYERYASADASEIHVYERYADSDAALAHLLAFGRMFGERYARLVERRRFAVFGAPSAPLRELLDRFGARYFGPLDGFSRTAGSP